MAKRSERAEDAVQRVRASVGEEREEEGRWRRDTGEREWRRDNGYGRRWWEYGQFRGCDELSFGTAGERWGYRGRWEWCWTAGFEDAGEQRYGVMSRSRSFGLVCKG